MKTLNNLSEQIEQENLENSEENFSKLRKLFFYEKKYSDLDQRIGSIQSNLQTSADYESMLEVLKKLSYISKRENLLRLKGQVAAIFGSGKELLLTELIYQNVIDQLNPNEIAALLSAIIFQGKKYDDQALKDEKRKEITPNLEKAKHNLSKWKFDFPR